MARKDLLKGLIEDPQKQTPDSPLETKSASPAPSKSPRYSKGAIGAVSQSIAELKARALVELVADQIDPGGLQDRLDDDPEAHAKLVASIKEYGQQVPVMVRQDPNHEGRYQIVYGRRRVAALRELRLPVKAMVRDLNDRDLILAQGQENSARKDLSFIEKVHFARQMRDAGYDRKVICDALSVDKTVISRMFSVADGLPPKVIAAIGAAPSIGRNRWTELVAKIAETKTQEQTLLDAITKTGAKSSDARFEAVMASLAAPKAKPPATTPLKTHDGAKIGSAKRGKAGLTLTFSKADGFDDWLAANISQIHRDWKTRGE